MIHKILIFTLFFQILHSKDYIKLLSGKESYGVLEKVEETSILFKIEGNDFPQRIPLNILVEFKLEDGTVPDWFVKVDEKNKFENKKFLEEAQLKKEILELASKIHGNKYSKIFHKGDVLHRPNKNQREIFASQNEAISNGYKRCIACFDDALVLDGYNLEKNVAKQVNIEIRRREEILYEHPKLELLQKMMNQVLSEWNETLKGYKYRVQIIKDDSPNAMAVAGGSLYFTTGLLDLIEDDKELEMVMAHEIAHVERRHTLRHVREAERLSRNAQIAGLVSGIFVTGILSSDEYVADLGAITEMTTQIMKNSAELVSHGYNRELEAEADIVAQLHFKRKGYDPMPIVRILDKLATYSTSRGFSIGTNAYSNHPSIINRIHSVNNSEIISLHDNAISFVALSKTMETENIKNKPYGFDKSQLYDDKNKLLSINTDMIFKTVSAETNNYTLSFIGTIENFSNKDLEIINFTIDDFIDDKPYSYDFKDTKGLVVQKKSQSDFISTLEVDDNQLENFIENLKTKSLLFDIRLSNVQLNKGDEASKSLFSFIPINSDKAFLRSNRLIRFSTK